MEIVAKDVDAQHPLEHLDLKWKGPIREQHLVGEGVLVMKRTNQRTAFSGEDQCKGLIREQYLMGRKGLA